MSCRRKAITCGMEPILNGEVLLENVSKFARKIRNSKKLLNLKVKIMKKKKEISIVRSSAAEYLTFITATGESDVNAIYFKELLASVGLPESREEKYYNYSNLKEIEEAAEEYLAAA